MQRLRRIKALHFQCPICKITDYLEVPMYQDIIAFPRYVCSYCGYDARIKIEWQDIHPQEPQPEIAEEEEMAKKKKKKPIATGQTVPKSKKKKKRK